MFLTDKHFEGCGGLTLTEEMKVTITSEACLLLLHLEGTFYPTLRTAPVYPHGFVPKLARSPGTGEVAPPPARLMAESRGDGVVVISWDDVVRGACNPGDGDNVVLHEFAHQMDVEDGVTDGAPVLPPSAVRTWGNVLSEEMEAFFEKPVRLEREHPELYGQLQQFYRQDPARRAPPPPAPAP